MSRAILVIGKNRETGKDEILAGRDVPYQEQITLYRKLGESKVNDQYSDVALIYANDHCKRPLRFISTKEAEEQKQKAAAIQKAKAEAVAKAKGEEAAKAKEAKAKKAVKQPKEPATTPPTSQAPTEPATPLAPPEGGEGSNPPPIE